MVVFFFIMVGYIHKVAITLLGFIGFFVAPEIIVSFIICYTVLWQIIDYEI